jgi:hypothetical protein
MYWPFDLSYFDHVIYSYLGKQYSQRRKTQDGPIVANGVHWQY